MDRENMCRRSNRKPRRKRKIHITIRHELEELPITNNYEYELNAFAQPPNDSIHLRFLQNGQKNKSMHAIGIE